uniref:Uncharacterized protein n=1 Tax=Sphaeramia orbicularis TaxID=375764 RepID=A0A673C3S0_9TELE
MMHKTKEQMCPPGKQCLLPKPHQILQAGSVQDPHPRSALIPPLIPGSLEAGWPSRWH